MVKIKTEIRREKILKLKKEGKTTEQIAQELRISSSTVYSDLNAMKNPTKKRVTNKEKSTKKNATNKFDINDIDVRELYGETSIPKVKLKKLEQYITNCKKKFKKGSLEKQEMKKIQEIIMLRGKYDDIIFYIGICIKFKMFAEAKFQINSQINNEKLTSKQKEKMLELKDKIQLTEQKYIALKVLQSGKGTLTQRIHEAKIRSGLLEVDVLELNRKYFSNKKQITNDENDEPNK